MPEDQESLTELVITAPEPFGAEFTYALRCRTTMGALIQLVARAHRRVVIAAPFFQSGYGVSYGPLADAVEAALQRGVDVEVVSTGQSLEVVDQARFRERATGHLRLYRPRANVLRGEHLGSHAKFCVADGEAAYVGSANLTGPGLGSQLEMGVLVHGSTARQIADFWAYCVEAGLFVAA